MKTVKLLAILTLTSLLTFSCSSSEDEGLGCADQVVLLVRFCVIENEGQPNEEEVCQYTVGYAPINYNGNQDDVTEIETNEATYNYYDERFEAINGGITCWEGER